jgi:predicted RNA binding protein YcfA (HicA-like mRNA interferase family)
MNKQKLLEKILAGSKNLSFHDFVGLVRAFGFEESRVRGSHHIFEHPKVREHLNLQEVNGQVKPYQVRQFLQIVEQYDLKLEE